MIDEKDYLVYKESMEFRALSSYLFICLFIVSAQAHRVLNLLDRL